MNVDEAILILRAHCKTDWAAAEYVGYSPQYYYALLALDEKMPDKAKTRIINAAELLVLRQQNSSSRRDYAEATA